MGYLRNDVPVGHPLFGKLTACPRCRMPEETRRLQNMVLPAGGLLPREQALTMTDLVERGAGSRAVIAAAARMIDSPFGMLTIWGGPGNGKTLALQVLVNAWLARGQSAVYLRLADLLEYLRAGYEPEEPIDTSDRYKRLVLVDLLALDEFDKARITEWGREWLYTLVDDRYRLARERGIAQRNTALATNDDPGTLPAHLLSRLRYDMNGPDGFRIIHNVDPDARPSGL